MKKVICFILALLALGVILLLPLPPQIETTKGVIALTLQGKAALAVLVMVVMLWVTEAVPFPIAGFMGLVALVMTKASELKPLVQDGFGNSIILFFIGVLIFSAAIAQTNLLKRLTTFLLYKLGHKPSAIILTFITVGAVLSGWITAMAVAAMLMPIAVTILKDAKVEPLKSNFGRALLIACAWGPLVGGVATPAGCGPNPLTMTFLKDLAGIDFSFVDWMLLGVPATIMMIPCAWFILIRVFPLEPISLAVAKEDFEKQRAELGKLQRNEITTLVIFLLTVFLWICGKWIGDWTGGAIDYLGIKFVAIACACLFFVPGIGVIDWKTAEKEISWGGIILIVTGLSLGMTIYKTGAAAWMAQVAFSKLGLLHPIAIIFAVVLGVSIMKVMFSSNTVTGIIMVPLLIALAKQIDIDPLLLAIPAGITSSLAFLLVTSTPTNVIPYSAGYFTIRDMAKAGVWMTLASSACVTVSIAIMGRLTGIVSW
ncbi:MAG: DASS family sodium-coupled anion symporter [Lentisphaerae bacterium]|nr:DASS family sodium-coupled anion symporter [Lentisphaerota bacterium]